MIAGGCRCGAVRYTLAQETLPPSYACHCHVCQRWSGSAFSLNVVVAEDRLSVSGPTVVYEATTADRTSTQRICGVCHSRVWNTNTARPGLAMIRAGTLDRSSELGCVAHIYTADRQQWLAIPDGVPSWPEAAPAAAFVALLTKEPA